MKAEDMEHHAYYIEGPLAAFSAYKSALRPVWAREFERFGVDEARELIVLASLKNFDTAVFLIAASSITHEAQQALLKLFEEPQRGTTFVLLMPHGSLIATLRSRMLPYPQKLALEKSSSAAKKFLGAPAAARSAAVAALLKDEEGARERVREFLTELELEMHHRLEKSNGKRELRQGLEDIARVRSYASDRSPSLKMLLEHLVLSLPTL